MTRAHVRRGLRFTTLIAAVFGTMIAVLVAVGAPAPANAANGADFRDGYIISDQNFTDSGSMTADAVQAFLNSQVTSCRGGNGWPCLKDYSQDTVTRGADAFCSTMPGGRMTAAQIIVAAAKACGISPKTLVVMLQKEQGLITDTAPDSHSYNAALGQACPDTAPCDPAYAGFANQVYGGARQLQMYLARPAWYAYQLGWNNILYSPNTSCGRKSVNILNDATRALYIYTPYTPNAAALANLYGTGDGCSAYGNRNFWRLYSDWFGDPTSSFEVRGDMGARWRAIGSSGSVVGPPIANEVCGWVPSDVNCYQNFAYGAISWTPSTGAWETFGQIRARWLLITAQYSQLGYPIGAPTCGTRDGGCYQNFQRGAISWTSWTGAWETFGKIRTFWLGRGAEGGPLGYPTSEITCPASGTCQQSFESGTVVDGTTGTYVTMGSINARWRATGGITGPLGAPTGAESCDWTAGKVNCTQAFAGGTIVWTPAAGAWEMPAKIDAYWTAGGGGASGLGFPAGAPSTAGSSTVQRFQWGTIVSSNAGTIRMLGSINARWLATGQVPGPLGAPISEEFCGTKDGGCYQNFENGAISWSPGTNAWETYGAIRSRWLSSGFEAGPLGYPIGPPSCGTKDNGCYQNFQNGAISWSANSGAWETYGAIRARWLGLGFESGVLGYPVGAPVCGTKDNGCYQNFQNGAISWSPNSGAWETYGAIRSYWLGLGFENGALGYPIGGVGMSGNESVQAFQGGVVAWDRLTNAVRRL